MLTRRDHLLSLAATAALAACGGGGGEPEPTPEPTPAPIPPPTPEPTPAPTPVPTPAPAPQAPGTVQVRAGAYLGIGTMDGTGTEAYFPTVGDFALAADGTLYVGGYMLRAVSPEGATRTLAGAWTAQRSRIDGPPGIGTLGGAAAIALAPDGALVIVDTEHPLPSRIRRLGTDGTFSTITELPAGVDGDLASMPDGFLHAAGSAIQRYTTATGLVPWAGGAPGHVDGPLADARFGEIVAVDAAPDGTVYVAQTSCVRKITPAGQVSTIGSPTQTGDADGSAATARFDTIRTVAAATDGTAIAWDEGGGLRRISQDGTVSTIDQPMRITATSSYAKLAIRPSGELLMSWGRGVVRLAGGHLDNFAGNGILPADLPQPLPTPKSFDVQGDGTVLFGTRAGNVPLAWNPSRNSYHPGSMAVGPDGSDLYFSTSAAPGPGGGVERRNASGETTYVVKWWETGETISPGPLSAGRDGNFYFVNLYSVVEGRKWPGDLMQMRPDGTTSVVLPRTVGDVSNEQRGGTLAATSDGTVYYLTIGGGLQRIRNRDATQVVPNGTFQFGAWLTVDFEDRVLVANGEVIHELTADGQLVIRAGTPLQIGPRSGPLPGVLPTLLAIAPGRDGLLYAVASNMLLTIRF